MTVWIALLRGVNVGGHKKLPMAKFRAVLAGLGFQDVVTYIQSGNAVLRTRGEAAKIARMIAVAVADNFGFEADVFVMRRDDLQSAIAQNPYPQAEQDAKTLHLFFLGEPAASFDAIGLQAFATKGEKFQLIGNVFYLYTPNCFGRSDLAAKISRFIKAPMTGRNLRSCQKILELASGI